MSTITHRVKTADDLQAPLYRALADAEKQGATLRVELDPGRHGELTLTSLSTPPTVSIELVGAGGIATLTGPLALDGRAVTVRDVVVEPGRVTAGVVTIGAAETITIDGLAVIGASSRAKDVREGALHLRALGPAVTATLARVWLVGNALDGRGRAALELEGSGNVRFAAVELTGAVFANNQAAYGVRTWFARQVTMRSIAVLEPALAQPWLFVRSPDTKLTLEDGVVATERLVEHDVDPDEAPLSSFPKVEVRRVTLRGPTAKEHVTATDSQHEPAAKAPASWDAVLDAARKLEAPDVAALAKRLR